MKLLFAITHITSITLFVTTRSEACPLSQGSNDVNDAPNDGTHAHLRKRRPLFPSLRENDQTRKIVASIVQPRTTRQRLLQDTPPSTCVSTSTYDSIRNDVTDLSQAFATDREKGHFIGGIVRLAAHDFMDFDINSSSQLGPDGCLDFTHPANAGLPDLWCDDPDSCPLKALYDGNYSFMSKADFWVAAANGVIQSTSLTSNSRPNGLVLPFRWGRMDADVCTESSSRLPEPHGCSEVEGAFVNRMGLSWTDAVALLGAHTLGRGDINFSGHDGTWVDSDEESTVFDKRFYEEVLRRSWRPRLVDAGVNWTWGGNNRGVMMLNTDICLFYDIPEGNDQSCCTDTTGNCRDDSTQNVQCPTAEEIRPEAFSAFTRFLGGENLNNGNQEPFYEAFTESWTKATELGYGDNDSPLFELPESCGPTTPSPTASPVVTPPTSQSPSITGTAAPVPVEAPVPVSCQDVESFQVEKYHGDGFKTLTCDEIEIDKCNRYGHLCPVTCDACDCLKSRMICQSDDDCCSGRCGDKGKCK